MKRSGFKRKPPAKKEPKTLKAKKCKAPSCRQWFVPWSTTQTACQPDCALELAGIASAKRARAEATQAAKDDRKARKERKAAKEAVRPRKYWLDKAQAAVNAFIRERDRFQPCISCGTMAPVQYAAGHFRPQGNNSALRFHHDNIHKQCNRNCNLGLSGNLSAYRPRLIERIGLERVLALESMNEPRRWQVDELKAIIKEHKALTKALQEKHGITPPPTEYDSRPIGMFPEDREPEPDD
jgi:hypothetical protein